VGTVYGSDVYTSDSAICPAAVHAGIITLAKGGQVTFEIRPKQSSYTASKRNGVTSEPYNTGKASYAFIK
jgi:hypothetical protein